MTDGSRQSLTKLAMSGAIAGVGGKIANFVIGIGSVAILARLLSPIEYGQFGLVMICLSLSQLIPQSISNAMVQQKQGRPEDISAGVTLVFAVGGVMACTLILLRHVISSFFGTDIVKPLIFTALVLPLLSLAAYFDGVLSKQFEFRKNAFFDFVSTVMGQAFISIGLAYFGFGVWSLLLGATSVGLIKLGLQFSAGVWRYIKPTRVPYELLSKSGWMVLYSIWNYLGRNADNLIVGKMLGSESLGLYQRAYNLMMRPVLLIGGVTTGVFYPLMASLQSDEERLRSAYLRGVLLASLFGLPMSLFLFVHATEMIVVLFGPRWVGVIEPFRLLALVLYFRLGYRISDATLLAEGAMRAVNLLQFLFAILVITGTIIGCRWGVTGVAAGVAFALLGFFVASAGYTNWRLGVGVYQFTKMQLPGVLIGGLSILPSLLLHKAVMSVAGPIGVLVIGGISLFISYGLVLSYGRYLFSEPLILSTLKDICLRLKIDKFK